MKTSIQTERSKVSQTSRTGFLYLDHLLHRLRFDFKADQIFGAPGSNRGIKASVYLRTLMEDVRALDEDECPLEPPTSDALGDWLRRHGMQQGYARPDIWLSRKSGVNRFAR